MGCDIHIYPEKFVDDKWIPAEPFKPSDWWWDCILDRMEDCDYSSEEYKQMELKFKSLTKQEAVEQYGDDPLFAWNGPWDRNYALRGRNYNWFATLVGIRNYSDVRPLDEPRGLPENVSTEVLRESNHIGSDGHSHSWFTLKELLEFNWDAEIGTYTGQVDGEEFALFLRHGYPDYWKGSTTSVGPNIISNDEMKHLLMGTVNGLNLAKNKKYYTEISWTQTYRGLIGRDYLQGILDKLTTYGEPDKVRMVFWFDN